VTGAQLGLESAPLRKQNIVGNSNMTKKIKVLTISDMPLMPSGVATQTKYMIEALLQSGKYEVVSIGGAIKHIDYTPKTVEGYGQDWRILPVDGYGTPDYLRQVVQHEKPDLLWFMTDPRFYGWLWDMEDEIRKSVPMVYYHVWDNFPAPKFNGTFYDSTDSVVTISKLTSECVRVAAPNVEEIYQPHAVDPAIFKKLTNEEDTLQLTNMRKKMGLEGKTVFMWNNRNAKRKQSGSLVFWFKDFLDKVGHDQAVLIMHTDVNDQHGQPLEYLAAVELGLKNGEIRFSKEKVQAKDLALMYNLADCTLNIADAEGFGLSSLESLSCGTPVINTMTGGLQEQVFDGEQYFGVGIEPASRAIIGTQQVPYIYEDRVSGGDVVAALETIHNMSKEERDAIGTAAQAHVNENYNFNKYKAFWVSYLEDLHNRLGSWDTRKGYNSWEVKEL